ncbi:MAG: hypothetical protein ACRD8Z_21805 [Nitrososphaeraceae archaeon]
MTAAIPATSDLSPVCTMATIGTGFGVHVAGDSPGVFMVPSQSIGVDGRASG